MKQSKYPIYIPTKGRANKPLTISMFLKHDIDIKVVVEPQEVEKYISVIDKKHLCVLPENNRGLVYARNFIKDHAIDNGCMRHWQFDDDIRYFECVHKGYRIQCDPNIAISTLEEFVDRYENVALASFNSSFFIPIASGMRRNFHPPFFLNSRCYTCFLMLNSLPNKWRYRYNEDTDMTLQVLADGWCTILFNLFLIHTEEAVGPREKNRGGQAQVYAGDGRLKMARELERVWPGVVTTSRRYGRPQHKIKKRWKGFDTKLIRRKDIDWDAISKKKPVLKLKKIREIRSENLRKLEAQDDESL